MDKIDCACTGKNLSKHIRPAILVILAHAPTHGYDIVHRLGDLTLFHGEMGPDASGVYRMLKLMEIEGLVHGTWEFGDSGPARRQFIITEAGIDCLRHWMDTLRHYRDGVDELLERMEQTLA